MNQIDWILSKGYDDHIIDVNFFEHPFEDIFRDIPFSEKRINYVYGIERGILSKVSELLKIEDQSQFE